MAEAQVREEAVFFAALYPYLKGTTVYGLMSRMGLPVRASAVVEDVYQGRAVPSVPFISRLLEIAHPPSRTRFARELSRLDRLHQELINALGLDSAHPVRDRNYEVANFYNLWTNDTQRYPFRTTDVPSRRRIANAPRASEWLETLPIHSEKVIQRAAEKAGIPTAGGSLPSEGPSKLARVSASPSVRVWEDAPGYSLKPDPMTAQSMAELLTLLRRFWWWADKPGMRALADRSGQAFSKSTATKLIHVEPGPQTPALSQKYVAGIIRGCGGDDTEISKWVTAFRLLDSAEEAEPRSPVIPIRLQRAQ
ncbi:hypothetical protein [Actinomadura nitritigenes]|uniref:hypothetical protein n=1 Tax=Actinomadura nitritigenes TaxID=134602 RepID=UPI003D90C911